MRRAFFGVGSGALLALGCAGSPPTAPPSRSVVAASPSPACAQADAARREAHQRLRTGQWFAALRRIQLADMSCPTHAGQSTEQVRRATQKLAAGLGVQPWQLLERAHVARLGGNLDEARLLEDQAAFGLEAASKNELQPSVPSVSDSGVEAFWSADSEWLLERSGQGLIRRRRGEWYPRLSVAAHADHTNDSAFASPDLGALLVADSAQVEDQADELARSYWITLVDVSASAQFGRVRARFEVARGAQAQFSKDGRVFAFAEATPDNRSRAPRSYFSWAVTATGELEHRIEAPAQGEFVREFRIDSPSQRALVQWQGGPITVVELATGRALVQPGPASDQYLHHDPFSPDGRFAVWPLATGRGPRAFMLFDLVKARGRRISATVCDLEQGLSFDKASRSLTLGARAGGTCELELESGRLQRQRVPPDSPPADVYSFVVPLGARVVPSPDRSFWALNARYTPQVFADGQSARVVSSPLARADPHLVPLGGTRFGVVNDARQWQWSPESGSVPLPAQPPPDVCNAEHLFAPGRHVAWYEQVDQDYSQQGLIDCKTGERSRPLEGRVSALALLDDARLVTTDPEQHDAGLVWDLKRGRVIGRFGFAGGSPVRSRYALTTDDRYLAVDDAIWDLQRTQRVAKLPLAMRDVTAIGKHALLVEQPGLVTIHRAPAFTPAGALVLADDATSQAIFGYGPDGRVNAIEVLGPKEAWDTTFSCAVGAAGVPFRICRETLERPGLLRALLE